MLHLFCQYFIVFYLIIIAPFSKFFLPLNGCGESLCFEFIHVVLVSRDDTNPVLQVFS